MVRLLFIVFILTSQFLAYTTAYSQPREQIKAVIEKLDREIERVKDLIATFPNQRAERLLDQARLARDQAVKLIEEHKFRKAEARVRQAFALLRQAEKIVLEGSIGRLRNQAEELMRRADNEVLGSNNKEAERILREAKKNHVAAERALKNNNFNIAAEHFRVALELAKRAIDLVRRSADTDREKIGEELHRFETLRVRAKEAVEKSNNPRAQEIYHKAMKMAFSAEEAVKNHNFILAKNLYNQSIMLLLRALDLAAGHSPEIKREFTRAMQQLNLLIERVRPQIEASANPRARRIFQRVLRFAQEAEIKAQKGRIHEALWKVELARNLLNRAAQFAKGRKIPRVRNRLQEEIEASRQDIRALKSKVDPETAPDAAILLNMSERAINRAEGALHAGFNRLALESIWAAQRFLNRADELANSPDHSTISRKFIESRLNQLNQAILEAERRFADEKQPMNLKLIEGAKDIREMALTSFRKGNYRAANEGIQVAFELVRKSLKNLPKK